MGGSEKAAGRGLRRRGLLVRLGAKQWESFLLDGRVKPPEDGLDLLFPGTHGPVERRADQRARLALKVGHRRFRGQISPGQTIHQFRRLFCRRRCDLAGRRLELLRCGVNGNAMNRRQGVAHELGFGHLRLDIRQVQVGIQQEKRIANRVDDI